MRTPADPIRPTFDPAEEARRSMYSSGRRADESPSKGRYSLVELQLPAPGTDSGSKPTHSETENKQS